MSAPIVGLWSRVREGTRSRAAFQMAGAPLQTQVGTLLREGTTLEHGTTRRACATILTLETGLWTFVTLQGVEPTNNAAARAVRRAVVWRPRCGGAPSTAGCRFAARLLTVVTTLRQQDRDVLDDLTAACTAGQYGTQPPSLLPGSAPLAAGISALQPAA